MRVRRSRFSLETREIDTMSPMKRLGSHADDFAGTISIDQLARRWHTTRREIRRMLGGGKMTFVQIRGQLRVPREEVQRRERG